MAPTPDEQSFVTWLRENGAEFPKLAWPVVTPNGLRGAVATGAIASGEAMLRIPKKLLISEELCLQDTELKPIYEGNRDVFTRDDPVIALFLMRELTKGDASFYAPYLRILPYPTTIQDWTEDELSELRDSYLVDMAKRRIAEVRVFYSRIFDRLDEKYPGRFPRSEYTFERFAWMWKTIQARTFGRRLPWTALVPFADCLNHQNVATKYDFDVDGNGVFRLFPSRTNAYEQGSEVFNSYGRRPNSQLLLDYGFALEHNEWDTVDIELPRAAPAAKAKTTFRRRSMRIDCHTSLDEVLAMDMSAEAADNQAEWLRVLHEALSTALKSFDTSVAQDEETLQQHGERLSDRKCVAIVYRVNRMKIVERLLNEVSEALAKHTALGSAAIDISAGMQQLEIAQ
ncbi:TPA: hypothetical protein N0F65_012681 [Lagenidium giganteum]|uniref:Rubisco LSMT substrate-binding domain-containing protein n=1 Tax=Lagenidium giganteum TaxID=4803 RepID=A0AAV2YLM3_9STRA|nr:TPA: hypothetical protein N0F65_012681 [Lagenidium giganteum]